MQEKISGYVAALTVQEKSGYELAARECAIYFDEHGIDVPSDSDWKDFEEYCRSKYRREKGKDISETTLQQNYIRRGKAFYRWCREQDTPSLILTEAPPLIVNAETANSLEGEEAEPIEEKRQSETSRSENEKPVRTSLLIDAQTYKMLALLAALENKTMTEILTAGANLYIEKHSKEAAKLQEAIEARSK